MSRNLPFTSKTRGSGPKDQSAKSEITDNSIAGAESEGNPPTHADAGSSELFKFLWGRKYDDASTSTSTRNPNSRQKGILTLWERLRGVTAGRK